MKIIDDIMGFYLDATNGCQHMSESMIDNQKQVSQKTGLSVEILDTRSFAYAKNKEKCDKNIWQHKCTQGEFKKRNVVGGKNFITLTRLALVQINEYWENHYRSLVAFGIGKSKNDLKIDIMGDIRLLRNAILKNKGRAQFTNKMQIIKKFKESDEITFNPEEFEQIVTKIKEEMQEL